jgi:hypothetical protein
MPIDSDDIEAKPRRVRQPVKARLLRLSDLDKRTLAAKRAFQLRDAILSERGGAELMGVLRAAIANDVAVTSVMIEHEQAKWLAGESVDVGQLATLINVRRRDCEAIGLDPKRDIKDVTPSLDDIAAELAAEDEAASEPDSN